MKLLNKILPIFIIIFFMSFMNHDFHTSTTKIEFNTGSTSLVFTSKFVTEDLEKALGINAEDEFRFNDAVEKYLKSNFKIKINGSFKTFNYASAQTSPKATRLYFEIPNMGDISSIEIKNTMLLNEFPDQQNFMTFNIQGKRSNFVSKRGDETGVMTF